MLTRGELERGAKRAYGEPSPKRRSRPVQGPKGRPPCEVLAEEGVRFEEPDGA